MIYKLELENYSCYSTFTKDFDEWLNIISGSNGTGKTTIVEAIGFALFDSSPESDLLEFDIRGNFIEGNIINKRFLR